MISRKFAAMAWTGSAFLLKGTGLCKHGAVSPTRSSIYDLFGLPRQGYHSRLPFGSGSALPGIASMPRIRIRPQKIVAARRNVNGILPADEHDASHSDEKKKFLDRQKALEAAMADINSQFGKGSVSKLGSYSGALVETFPSGCLTLDLALGGGLPKGRIIEIFGSESSGKTTLALHAIAEVQKGGGNAMLIDAEHSFDKSYAKRLGVDVSSLVVSQPDNGEMALECADRMIRSGAMDIICIDSVSALTPRAEVEGEIGVQQVGGQARLMSSALRKLAVNASRSNCTLIFLNQIRLKVGVIYGNPETTSGGMALKFYASVRIEIRPGQKFKSPKGDEDVGIRVKAKIVKSKVSKPYRVCEFDLIFGHGISQLGCLVDCAETMGIISKKGSWYSHGEQRLGQGRERVVQMLRESRELRDTVERGVREKIAEAAKSGDAFDTDEEEEVPPELLLEEDALAVEEAV